MKNVSVRLKNGEEEVFQGEVAIKSGNGYNPEWLGLSSRCVIFETAGGFSLYNLDSVESVIVEKKEEGPSGPAAR